jgi:hypothetical protein
MECAGSPHLREEAHCWKKLSLGERQVHSGWAFGKLWPFAQWCRLPVRQRGPKTVAHPLVESSRLAPAALPRLEDCMLTSTLGPKAPKKP